ncbi:hypothetical protein JKV81_28750 [Streptomyces sp. For3]|uniref:hypothetical protein n=1 Tax=Streptomyces TaxID=1883 RepID=UPI00100F7982|nr:MULTISPECIES: hypothetical protein [Streptomyces]MBL1290816.1 hypothetical protein [Streptomyces silvae]
MHISHRSATVRSLTALALSLMALTACGGKGEGQSAGTAPAASATPATSDSGSPSVPADGTASTPAPGSDEPSASASAGDTGPVAASSTSAAPWAGTKQFVQIDDARITDGRTYLSVRPAQKKAHPEFEAWVIVPGKGPYTEVPMAEDATVLLSVPLGDAKHPASYSQADFVSRLKARSSTEAPMLLGYDVSFDGEGRITRLQSLYTP